MKNINEKISLKKNDKQYPYIIIRQFSAVYTKVFIRDMSEKDLKLGGVLIENVDRSETKKFQEACFSRLITIWLSKSKKGTHMNVCLVLDAETAYYISRTGKITISSIPSGGLLIDSKGKPISLNRESHI